MAITTAGFTGTVNEAQWAQFMELAMGGNAAQVVESGLDCSSGGATRLITVAAGEGAAAGVLFTNTAGVTVTLNANGAANNRADVIVAEINWTADTVTFTKVTGTTGSVVPVIPAVTQTAGTLWQIPLAVVTVKPGSTTIAAGDIADVRPFRPALKVYTPAVTGTTVGQAAAPKTICSRTIPDPGWPYRIRVAGGIEFTATASGRGIVNVTLDGVGFTAARASQGNAGQAIIRTMTSGVLTGSHDIVVTMQAFNMGEALASQAADSSVLIEVIPA